MSIQGQYSIIGSDGRMERYIDEFAGVTPELQAEAEVAQQTILDYKMTIEKSYIRLGAVLAHFKEQELHRAVGYPTFKAWTESPEIGFGYRLCMNLIRIASELLPILVRNDAIDAVSTVSNMSALLPILTDPTADETVVEAAYRVKELTNRDAVEYVKELRGQGTDINESTPAIFYAKLRRGIEYHHVQVFCGNGTTYYEVGTLRVMPADWPRLEARFGRFVEIIE